MESKYRKLHPSSSLFYLGYTVIHLLFPSFMIMSNDLIPLYIKYSFGGVFLFLLFWSIIRFRFYGFILKENEIEIAEGIVFKSNRKIPYLRIQNVNIKQNPFHRFFNVATLQLESASGGRAEATMRVVEMDLVEQIKKKVKLAHQGTAKIVEVEEPLVNIERKDLINYGLIKQKGMIYTAIFFGFLVQYEEFVIRFTSYLGEIYGIPDFSKVTLMEGVVYLSFSTLFLFSLLQLLSVLWSVVKFDKFTMVKENERLQTSMGLFSKLSATIPLKRIQLYRVSENPLHRYFKAKSIDIETAGGVNSGSKGIVMSWLTPYIKASKADELIQEVEPKIKIDSIEWQLIPQRAWKRVLVRSLLGLSLFIFALLLLSLSPKIEIQSYAWVVIFLMFPLSYLYAKKYVQRTAYFFNEDLICFRSGVWFVEESYVKVDKIQTVEILESPFDRRNQMATLEVDTAGSDLMLHHVRIPYLELNDAYKIRDFIQSRVNHMELSW